MYSRHDHKCAKRAFTFTLSRIVRGKVGAQNGILSTDVSDGRKDAHNCGYDRRLFRACRRTYRRMIDLDMLNGHARDRIGSGRHTVRSVIDASALDDGTICTHQGCTDAELGIGYICMFFGLRAFVVSTGCGVRVRIYLG